MDEANLEKQALLDTQKQLNQQISDLKFHLQILQGRAKYSSLFKGLNGETYDSMGQEIARLKSTIDTNIHVLPTQDQISNLSDKVEELTKINKNLTEKAELATKQEEIQK